MNIAVFFAIQDTTYLDYTDHPSTRGLGSIGTKSQKRSGLVKHTTLIVSESGLALGCLTDKVWVRDGFGVKDHKSKKLEEKESYRWIEALSEVKSATPHGVEVIFLSDRESDIYEFFVEAGETPFVIRAAQDRCVDASVGKLSALVRSQEVAGEFRTQVAKRGQPTGSGGDPKCSLDKDDALPAASAGFRVRSVASCGGVSCMGGGNRST